jgi:FtsP/CotA-like multicopper oxidase with cupredoxin domain
MPYVHMHAGQTERWRFINSSSARYFMLHLAENFKIIGTDGGLIEQPVSHKVLITPGEGWIFLLDPLRKMMPSPLNHCHITG